MGMTLRINLTIFLITSTMSAPQKLNIQEFFNSGGLEAILYNPVIQRRILEHDLNPCTGEPPKTCTCSDGKTFPFSIEYRTDPCSIPAKLESCTCPDDSTFKIKDLIRDIIKKYDLPNCGAGVEPEFCSCNDGDTFDPKPVRGGGESRDARVVGRATGRGEGSNA